MREGVDQFLIRSISPIAIPDHDVQTKGVAVLSLCTCCACWALSSIDRSVLLSLNEALNFSI